MSLLTQFLASAGASGSTPIGGIIPVIGGYNVAGTDYLECDGSDVLSSTISQLAPLLDPATSFTLRQLPSSTGITTDFLGAIGTKIFSFVKGVGTIPYVTENGDDWYQVYKTWTGTTFTYYLLNNNNTIAVAVNDDANTTTQYFKYQTSTDGINWTERINNAIQLSYTADSSNYEFSKVGAIAYVNNQWVAAIDVYQVYWQNAIIYSILTSPDGITWTRTATGIPANNHRFTGIAYGAGLYVICNRNGQGVATTIYTSTNLANGSWTARTVPNNQPWAGIAFGNGIFVIVGGAASASTVAASSTDGITWTQRVVPSGIYKKVLFANGIFVAIHDTGIASSTDGITWTARSVPSAAYKDVVYSATLGFMAIGNNGAILVASTDGVTWVQKNYSGPYSATNIVVNSSGYLVTNGSISALVSSDGITWNTRTFSNSYGGGTVAASDSFYIASVNPGTESDMAVMPLNTSPDGITWTNNNQYYFPWYNVSSQICACIKYLNGNFFVISSQVNTAAGFVYSSSAANPVSTVQSGTDKWIKQSFYINEGLYNYITNSGGLQTFSYRVKDIAYGNGVYVCVGHNAVSSYLTGSRAVLVSDGVVPLNANSFSSFVTLPASVLWTSIAFGNGVFVAISKKPPSNLGTGDSTIYSDIPDVSGRIVAVSKDGISWRSSYLPTSGSWTSIVFTGTMFIAVDSTSNLYATSKDGITWNQRAMRFKSNGNKFIVSKGDNTAIVIQGSEQFATRITQSANTVQLPFVQSQNNVNYLVRSK